MTEATEVTAGLQAASEAAVAPASSDLDASSSHSTSSSVVRFGASEGAAFRFVGPFRFVSCIGLEATATTGLAWEAEGTKLASGLGMGATNALCMAPEPVSSRTVADA